MARKFVVPFGVDGDRVAIPNPLQPDGSVSMTRGFGTDYELADTDPNYKPFPRQPYNGLMFDITDAIFEMQLNGLATWDMLAAPYPLNALLRHNNGNWRSTIANNNSEPGAVGNDTWVDASAAAQMLDTLRVNVNAAALIDLVANAPQTRHINVIGAANIAGFGIAAGQCYFVKFSGTPVLVASAALTTQSGRNIQVTPGDTCLIRAIANNSVEILFYTTGIPQALGQGQSWLNVTTGRALGATFVNSTGRPIAIKIHSELNAGSPGRIQAYINTDPPMIIGASFSTATATYMVGDLIIPTGAEYRVLILGGPGLTNWYELRD